MASPNQDRDLMLKEAELIVNKPRDAEILADHDQMIHQMQPSCLVIATLGRIMLVTHQDDVSLENNAPQGGFQYIKHPNSLRASLVQISNDSFEAFKSSHINMTDIKNLTFDIPDVMDTVIDAIAQGDDEDVQISVQDALEELSDTVKKCKTLAENTRSKYDHVIVGVQEVLLAATSTKQSLEARDKQLKDRQMELELLKTTNEKACKEAEESKRKFDNDIEKAKAEYIKAKEKMPGAGKMVALSTIDTVQSIVTAPLKILSPIASVGRMIFKKGGSTEEKEKDTLVTATIKKAQIQIEEAREEVKRYEQKKESADKEALDNHRKMMEDMAELRTIDFSRTDIDSVKRSLEKGMTALTSMQAIWNNLAMFFANIVSLVEHRFGKDINAFTKKTKNYLKHENDFQRMIMFKCLTKATESSIVLNSLSSTYVDVSHNYIMPALGKLPALIYPKEGACISELAAKLDEECDTSMRKIYERAIEKRYETKQRLQALVRASSQRGK